MEILFVVYIALLIGITSCLQTDGLRADEWNQQKSNYNAAEDMFKEYKVSHQHLVRKFTSMKVLIQQLEEILDNMDQNDFQYQDKHENTSYYLQLLKTCLFLDKTGETRYLDQGISRSPVRNTTNKQHKKRAHRHDKFIWKSRHGFLASMSYKVFHSLLFVTNHVVILCVYIMIFHISTQIPLINIFLAQAIKLITSILKLLGFSEEKWWTMHSAVSIQNEVFNQEIEFRNEKLRKNNYAKKPKRKMEGYLKSVGSICQRPVHTRDQSKSDIESFASKASSAHNSLTKLTDSIMDFVFIDDNPKETEKTLTRQELLTKIPKVNEKKQKNQAKHAVIEYFSDKMAKEFSKTLDATISEAHKKLCVPPEWFIEPKSKAVLGFQQNLHCILTFCSQFRKLCSVDGQQIVKFLMQYHQNKFQVAIKIKLEHSALD